MQRGHDDLERRHAPVFVDANRYAAAVVDNRDRAVGIDLDLDFIAVAGHRLVYAVGNDLFDEVMEAARACVADVHGGPLANGFHVLQYFYRLGVIIIVFGEVFFCHILPDRLPLRPI